MSRARSFRFRDPEWFSGLPQTEQEKIKKDIRKDRLVLKKWLMVSLACVVYSVSVLLIGLGSREFFELIGLGKDVTGNNLFILPWIFLSFMLFGYVRSAVLNHPYFILAEILKK